MPYSPPYPSQAFSLTRPFDEHPCLEYFTMYASEMSVEHEERQRIYALIALLQRVNEDRDAYIGGLPIDEFFGKTDILHRAWIAKELEKMRIFKAAIRDLKSCMVPCEKKADVTKEIFVTMSFRVTESLADAIKEAASFLGCGASEWIREAAQAKLGTGRRKPTAPPAKPATAEVSIEVGIPAAKPFAFPKCPPPEPLSDLSDEDAALMRSKG